MKIQTDVMRPSGWTGRASRKARTIAAVKRYCIRPNQHTPASTGSTWPRATRASEAAATATDSLVPLVAQFGQVAAAELTERIVRHRRGGSPRKRLSDGVRD